MTEYLSMYRKDYLWPEVPPHFSRTDNVCVSDGPLKPDKHACGCDRESKCRSTEQNEKLILQKCPETRIPKYSSTDACLRKLMEENPNLFNIIRKVPVPSALKKFNEDRLKSTYQVDYLHGGKEEETNWTPAEKSPCPMDDPGPKKVDCRPATSSRLAILKMMREGSQPKTEPCAAKPKYRHARNRKNGNVPQYQLKVLPAWSTEYRDMINGTGNEVLKMMRLTRSQREKIELHRKYREPICIS